MPFTQALPEWNAIGIEPPQSLKDSGWLAGMKPPDAYFNWYMYNTYRALLELQAKAALKDEITISDASTTQKGIVQLSNSTTSTSETMAATSKAVKDVADALTTHSDDYVKHPGTGITTNTGNDYAVILNPAPTSYLASMGIVLTINADSTGAATLNVNGLGAKPIKKANGNDVTNLKANGVYTVRYNSAANASAGAFILQGEGGEYGTAVAADVLTGKTIGTENGLINGTMPNNGAGGTVTPTTTNQTKPAGFYPSAITIAGDPDLIAANILSGKNIFGVAGTVIAGKRFASGSATATWNANVLSMTVSGLAFTPAVVVVLGAGFYGFDNVLAAIINGTNYFIYGNLASSNGLPSGNGHVADIRNQVATVSAGGFTAKLAESSSDVTPPNIAANYWAFE